MGTAIRFFSRAAFLFLALTAADAFAAGLPQGQSTWSGRYDYQDGKPGAPFTLTINSSGSNFSGGTSEPATFGDGSSSTLTANVAGSVNGNQVSFVKTYDGSGGQHHSIQYNGTLSADGRSISGRWNIGPNWSGPFSAQLTSAPVVAEPSCSNWLQQPDGSNFRLCVDNSGRHYCESEKGGSVSRVGCN